MNQALTFPTGIRRALRRVELLEALLSAALSARETA